MVLIVHIIAALASMALSTIALFSPSRLKIRVSSYLVGITLASGTYIIVSKHLSILSVCISGLLYVGFTLTLLIAASHRLAGQAQKDD